jgi:hypothetical protein
MSADIIRFIPRPKSDRAATDFPTIAFRSTVQSDRAASDQGDTAPCEYAPCSCEEKSDEVLRPPPVTIA